MDFPSGQTVIRQRATLKTDPYSKKQTASSWDAPDQLEIPGAFVAQSSTARSMTATRTQSVEDKSLYCPPDADVLEGDRIVAAGVVYEIDGFPSADQNPFTGWQPAREIPLNRRKG